MSDNPKVFISYAHDDEAFADKILSFTNKLRSDGYGIDANIDQYEDSPPEGWPRWMENQIRQSDFVLIVCTQLYFQKCYEIDSKSGKGVSWEVLITYQHIYDSHSNNTKFIPVIFDSADEQFVPMPIKGATIYNVTDSKRFDELYWRLRGIKKTEKPPLGELKPLPVKERKVMFYSSQINLELWDKAKWSGMLYLFGANEPPILCFLFDNYQAGVKIFSEWKKQAATINNDLELTFVEAPFPEESIVFTDTDYNNGKGYFVHVGSNFDGTLNRMQQQVDSIAETLFVSVSRYHWMHEYNGTWNRETFKAGLKHFGKCYIAPVHLKNKNAPIEMDNIIFVEDSKIEFSNIRFTTGNKLDIHDIATCVLGEKYTKKILGRQGR